MEKHVTMTSVRPPRAGDVLRLDREASVQFTSPIVVRFIRWHDWHAMGDDVGWRWIDVYQLDPETGEAVERRSLYINTRGARLNVPAAMAA